MFYPVFLLITALEMVGELWISVRNSSALLAKGATDIAPRILLFMSALYVVMYLGSFAEFLVFPKVLRLSWVLPFAVLFIIAKLLKFWAISSLGSYWTMKVLVVPGSRVVTGGPYRWIRHPNYLAVLIEIAATTLIGKSYLTFLFVFALFAVVLCYRIQSEEEALAKWTDYPEQMLTRRRFFP